MERRRRGRETEEMREIFMSASWDTPPGGRFYPREASKDVVEVEVEPRVLVAEPVVHHDDRGLVPGDPQPAPLRALPVREGGLPHVVEDAPDVQERNGDEGEALLQDAELRERPPHLVVRQRHDRADEAVLRVAPQRPEAPEPG